MRLIQRSGGPVKSDEPRAATIAALTDVLRSESRLLRELLVVVRRQREAVIAEDLRAVEESVYATHRVLHTLNEARRRRRGINHVLGEGDDLSLGGIGQALGADMPDELRRARDELESCARMLTREVRDNRRILRDALATADSGSCERRGPLDACTGDGGTRAREPGAAANGASIGVTEEAMPRPFDLFERR